MGLETQSGKTACQGIDGDKRRDLANTSDTRGRDPTVMPDEEGILTSERIVRI